MDGRRIVLGCTICLMALSCVQGQGNITRTIGFNQLRTTVTESGSGVIDISLAPNAVSSNIIGRVVPLRVDQFESYMANLSRNVPEVIQQAIDSITDPAESEEEANGTKDFDNSIINFTLAAQRTKYTLNLSGIVFDDNINEDMEEFILVLELYDVLDPDIIEFEDQYEGILIVGIEDDDEIYLLFEPTVITFIESDGTVSNIINITKRIDSAEKSEVGLPLQVVAMTGSSGLVDDTDVIGVNNTYTFEASDTSIILNPITIVNDTSPETKEKFTLSLLKGDNSESLNYFLINTDVILTIYDDDIAHVGFDMSTYTTTEGEFPSVEVCINLTEGQSLQTSTAYGNFSIEVSANASQDYETNLMKKVLTVMRGQERDCTNITIFDDVMVERDEEFTISLSNITDSFGAGVNITRAMATVVIKDDDGAIVGFNETSYIANEGEILEVCVFIHSPNETILQQSSVFGNFTISYAGEQGSEDDIALNITSIYLNTSVNCFNVSIMQDDLVEGTESLELAIELNTGADYFGIRSVQPNTTTITIVDQDIAEIGFESNSYTITEGDQMASIMICVNLTSGTIASGYSINYSLTLITDSKTKDLMLNSSDGSFIDNMNKSCHDIDLQNDEVAEENNTATLNIAALSENTRIVSVNSATIQVMDDDSVTVTLEHSIYTIPEGDFATLYVAYEGAIHQESIVYIMINNSDTDTACHSVTNTSTCGVDYTIEDTMGNMLIPPFPLTLNINSTSQSFTVMAVSDNTVESTHETVLLTASIGSQTRVQTDLGSHTSNIFIENTDVVRFQFSETSYEFIEDSTTSKTINVMAINSSIVLNTNVNVSITIGMSSNATKGLPDGDYNGSSIDLGFTFNNLTQTDLWQIQIPINNDTLVEGNEVVFLSLNEPVIGMNSNGATLGKNNVTQVIIIDDDVVNVGFTSHFYSATEGNMTEICIMIFNGTLASEIVLDYLISIPAADNTSSILCSNNDAICLATESADFESDTFRRPLRASATKQCVKIQLLEDTIVEAAERFSVQVEQVISSSDLVFGLEPEFAVVTILDNDEIMLGFELSEYYFNESGYQLPHVFVVTENEVTVSTSFSVIVSLLSTSTATYGDDFSVPGEFNVTITFNGNDARHEFPINITDDEVAEGDESIQLTLTTDSELERVIRGVNHTAVVIIVEDDFIGYTYSMAEYSFMEGNMDTAVCLNITSGMFPPGGYINFALTTHEQTANSTEDYDAQLNPSTGTLDNSTRQTCFNLTIVDDNLVEGRETLVVQLTVTQVEGSFSLEGMHRTVVTILDNDVAEVGFTAALYTVVEGEEKEVTVCVSILSGDITDLIFLQFNLSAYPSSAAANEDYIPTIIPDSGNVSLYANMTCHTISILDDETVEPPEIFVVNITSTGPSDEFITLFNLTVEETAVQIIDNDSLSVGYEFISYTTTENDSNVELCILFRGPLKNDSFVELSLSIISASATDDDYASPVPGKIQLNLNQSKSCVSINITDDNIVEGTEMFNVMFSETNISQVMIVGNDSVPVYIQDNDVVRLKFQSTNYTFVEGQDSSSAVITIVIDNFSLLNLRNDVFVTVFTLVANSNATETTGVGGGDYRLISSTVNIFTGLSIGEVSMEISEDSIVEGVEVITLAMSSGVVAGVTGGKTLVDTVDQYTTVLIEDNNTVTVGFSDTTYSAAEGNVTVCVSVQSGVLGPNVTIYYFIIAVNNTASVSDFKPLEEEGYLSQSYQENCHTLTIIDDNLVEAVEMLTVEMVPIYNVANVQLLPNYTTINIHDEDDLQQSGEVYINYAVSIGFEKMHYFVTEKSEVAVSVQLIREDLLNSTHGFNVTITVSASSNATEGIDFRITTPAISFDKNTNSMTLEVMTINDKLGEGDEIILLEVLAASGNAINVESMQNRTTVTIMEDAEDRILVKFSSDVYTVGEGKNTEVCVEIEKGIPPPNGYVTFDVTTIPESALSGVDYVDDPEPNTGTLNEAMNKTCFTISTREDEIVEGTEHFTVAITFTDKFGAFTFGHMGNETKVFLSDNDVLQLGFEQVSYEVNEGSGTLHDTVHIVKLNNVTLQMSYTLMVEVVHSTGTYPAILDVDFAADSALMPTLGINDMKITVPFSVVDDVIEEGFENFTLLLSYEELIPSGTVNIVTPSTKIFIKDNDVVVIGFEKNSYVLFEGQETEICVSILDRKLTNEVQRKFTVKTQQVTQNFAIATTDYEDIVGFGSFIVKPSPMQRCFTVRSVDDAEEEAPERLEMTAIDVDHLIEFIPDTTSVWIVDDDSLVLPVPTLSDLNCSGQTKESTLTISCTPTSATIAQLLCALDGGELTVCGDVATLSHTIDLKEYSNNGHVLEIVALTHSVHWLRDIIRFNGEAEIFKLSCKQEESSPGVITINCTTPSVLESLTCTIDQGIERQCALKFELNPSVYDGGTHTLTIIAVNIMGETSTTHISFASSDSQQQSVLEDREVVSAIGVAGFALILLILLLITTCMLIHYYRKLNHVNKYSLDLRSENAYVTTERNLSFRENDPVELVDYARIPSSSTAAQPGSHLAQSRSQSPPSGSFNSGSQPDPRFWLPTQPMEGPSPVSIPTVPTSDEHSTEQQLLQATGGEGRGLKITRRHSVEDRQKHITEDATLEVGRIASFSGTGKGRREALYQEKQWESEMEKELEVEIAQEREREREREKARMRERRREKEQRERRREKEHRARDERAREREEREKERERAREKRLEKEEEEKSSPEVQEPPESFL